MVEYSIGSLADLISGTKTAHKTAVVKTKFVQKEQSHSEQTPQPEKEKAQSKKQKKTHLNNQNIQLGNENVSARPKKRKIIEFNALFLDGDDSENLQKSSKKFKKRKEVIKHQKEKKVKKRKHENEGEKSDDNDRKRFSPQKRAKKFKHNNEEHSTPEKRSNSRSREKTVPYNEEEDSRTVFVGNIVTTITKTQLTKLFSKYGEVESVRLRCAAPEDPKISKRVAVIRKMFHSKRQTLHCYVRFKTKEAVAKALDLNGVKYKGHYIRVTESARCDFGNERTSLFVGSLAFDIEEDELWQAFECCGKIKSVRVVRDPVQGIGKGFGYVNFENSDSVELALENDNFTIKNRKIVLKRFCKKKKPTDEWKGRVERPKKLGTDVKQKSRDAYERRFLSKSVPLKNSVFSGASAKDRQTKKKKLNKSVIKKVRMNKLVAPREQTATHT